MEAEDSYGSTPLMKAVTAHHLEIAELLLKMGADPDHRMASDLNQTALMLAATEGELDLVVLLLRYGADLDARDVQGRTPLNYAFAAARSRPVPLLCAFLCALITAPVPAAARRRACMPC